MSKSLQFGAVLLVTLSFGLEEHVLAQNPAGSSLTPAVPASSNKEQPVVELWTKTVELKRHLDDKGFAGSLTFVNDWSKSFRGGASSAGYVNRYSLDVSVAVDTRKTIGWNGGTGFFRLKNHLGENGGDYVGDAQGFSNIDDTARTRLYELWYEQKLSEDRLRLKLGKIDANSEFAVVRIAGDFLNSSMGYSPTILALPTYPEPKPGINVFVIPKQHYQASFGLFRGSGDMEMLILEGGRDWQVPHINLGGHVSLGMWHLSGLVPCFDGDHLAGTQGFYLVAEQAVWGRTRPDPSGPQQLTAFLQYGRANGDVSRFTRHIGGGIVFTGPFAARSHDAIGLAVTSVRFTDDPYAGYQYPYELVTEAYYKISLLRFFSLVPDAQFIRHPGGIVVQKDAFVLTPRINISF